MCIATGNSTFPIVVSPSAYPLAFPKALASETIPPPQPMRLTTYSAIDRCREQLRRLLRSQLPFCAERRLLLSTGFMTSACRSRVATACRLSFPILGKPINPRRLVHDNDGSDVDSLSLALSSSARRDSQLGFE